MANGICSPKVTIFEGLDGFFDVVRNEAPWQTAYKIRIPMLRHWG